jgi:hypothetical protein
VPTSDEEDVTRFAAAGIDACSRRPFTVHTDDES